MWQGFQLMLINNVLLINTFCLNWIEPVSCGKSWFKFHRLCPKGLRCLAHPGKVQKICHKAIPSGVSPSSAILELKSLCQGGVTASLCLCRPRSDGWTWKFLQRIQPSLPAVMVVIEIKSYICAKHKTTLRNTPQQLRRKAVYFLLHTAILPHLVCLPLLLF